MLLELYESMVANIRQRNLKVDIEPMISMKWLKPTKNEKRRARQRGIAKFPKKLVCFVVMFSVNSLSTSVVC